MYKYMYKTVKPFPERFLQASIEFDFLVSFL